MIKIPKTLIEIDLGKLRLFFASLTKYSEDENYKRGVYCRSNDKNMSFCFGGVDGGVCTSDVRFSIVEFNLNIIKLQEENKQLKKLLQTIETLSQTYKEND